MKQVLQNLRSGLTDVAEVPCPVARPGHLLIRTSRSLISSGTERMLVEFGRAGVLEKARQQPEKVKTAVAKIKTDGLLATVDAIRNKLDQPVPLGYCNVGTILQGSPDHGFYKGDRVVSNGKHAEVVSVPVNLCAKVPPGVSDEEAAFTVLGAIALQGIRLAAPAIGETVAVFGMGLVGLLTVQLLRAQGCRVIGFDFAADRLSLARTFGAQTHDLSLAQDPVPAALEYSRGRGVDAVLITASTSSNEPVHYAAQMSRKRGRIVLVGQAGLEISRDDFYEKELTFQVSCSYGPGRYDVAYEEKGIDYPVGFVRWTEQRNFEAVLDMLADRRLHIQPLVSHRFAISAAQEAYDLITRDEPSLGVLLEYPDPSEQSDAILQTATVPLNAAVPRQSTNRVDCRVGFIGAGNYATAALLPAFCASGCTLATIASRDGVSGLHAGKKYGFLTTTTDTPALLADPEIDAVIVATRHDSHARLVIQALRAGKHVFVEKPLGITSAEIQAIEDTYADVASAGSPPVLTVGFNRRAAPHIVKMRELLAAAVGPKAFIYTVNAGAGIQSHWTQDREVHGGRLVGEACHFIDLLRCLAGSPIRQYATSCMVNNHADTATVTLQFEDGSSGAIHYLTNGNKSFPKERLEVFAAGAVLQLDNFRRLQGYGWPGFSRMKLWRQDKGQTAWAQAFVNAVRHGGMPPIPIDQIFEVARIAVAIGSEHP